MKVEAYLRAQIPGYPFEIADLESAVISPLFAKPERMQDISLNDMVEDYANDDEWVRALKYAISTLYYSVSGMFSGGSRSERVGDIQTSRSGFVITQSDRAYYRRLADSLRDEIGAEREKSQDDGGMFDATNLRYR